MPEIEEIQTLNLEQQIVNVPIREFDRMNTILNETGIINNLMYCLVKISDLPTLLKILMAGGTCIGIVGGVYIAYRIINRITPRITTIVTPIGIMP